MMFESCRPNPNKLPFSQPYMLHIVNLAIPNLIAIINNSHLTWILIQLKKLNDFYLQIKVIVFTRVFVSCSLVRYIFKLSDILARKYGMLNENFGDPISQVLYDFLLSFVKAEWFTKELKWIELSFINRFPLIINYNLLTFLLFYTKGRKKCPTTIKEDVSCELLNTFVCTNVSSMNSNDVSHSWWDRQIFKFLSK